MSSKNTDLFLPERPHHAIVMKVLCSLPPLISECGASFGGGTYCSMICGEYRRSDDIDFLCSDQDGYRELRYSIDENFFNGIAVRKMKIDRYAIRCMLEVDNTPIKFEIVSENSLDVIPINDPRFPVLVTSPEDLAAAKLLANSDRWPDAMTTSRDILDFGMLLHNFVLDPEKILERISERDFRIVNEGLVGGLKMLTNPKHFRLSSQKMEMDMRDMATARVAAKRFLAKFQEKMTAKAGNSTQP